MHASNHLKPLGHEVHGSYYTGEKRKKQFNPDEVGAVKDHFSEDRQQEKPRQQAQQKQSSDLKEETFSFEDEIDDQGLYKSRKAQYPGETLTARLTARVIQTLSEDPALRTADARNLGTTRPTNQASEPSLDDLLSLMLTK